MNRWMNVTSRVGYLATASQLELGCCRPLFLLSRLAGSLLESASRVRQRACNTGEGTGDSLLPVASSCLHLPSKDSPLQQQQFLSVAAVDTRLQNQRHHDHSEMPAPTEQCLLLKRSEFQVRRSLL